MSNELIERLGEGLHRFSGHLPPLLSKDSAAHADYERVVAAFQALSATPDAVEREGWQPIETAPKDGTRIDVWVGGEFAYRRTDVEWREPTDSEWWVHGGDTIETPDATWHDCFGPLDLKFEPPSHWRPIPAAPAINALHPSTAIVEGWEVSQGAGGAKNPVGVRP